MDIKTAHEPKKEIQTATQKISREVVSFEKRAHEDELISICRTWQKELELEDKFENDSEKNDSIGFKDLFA
jgi:hypothetical protein